MDVVTESERMLTDESLLYGKVYYTDSGGGSTWVQGVIEYDDYALLGGGGVVRVALVSRAPEVNELPAAEVGRINYKEPPEELAEKRSVVDDDD